MKLGNLVNENFIASLNALNEKQLPVHLAYKLSKITNKAAAEQKEYFILRNKLIDSLALKDDAGQLKSSQAEGKTFVDFGENMGTFLAEMEKLDATQVDVPTLMDSAEAFAEILSKCDIKMSAVEFNVLAPLFE